MAGLRVGNAPCSWGTLEFDQAQGKQVPWDRMLDELIDTGYTGAELGDWGYMPTDPSVLSREFGKRRLCMLGAFVPVALKDAAAHEPGAEAACRVARLLADVATDPQPFLVLADNNGDDPVRTADAGRIQPSQSLSPAEWDVFARGVNQIAEAVRKETGLRTVFHHHAAGYVETPDEIDRLLSLTDPELVGLVFDTGHYAFGAGNADVVAGMDRFRDRIRYMHFKDLDPDVAARSRTEKWDYFTSLRQALFCELGRGCVDFPAVLRWLKERRYEGYVLVEQDVLPGMGEPRESAGRNRQYLASVESCYA